MNPGRRALITGVTDGIGLALARRWSEKGDALVLHGRRAPEEAAKLDPDLFGVHPYWRCDLSRPGCGESVRAFLEEAGIESLDLLVLNAGLGWVGASADQSAASIKELVHVNLSAPMELCHALLPLMQRGEGQARSRIVFISSITAALPCKEFAVYGATKAALEGFARSLRIELSGRGKDGTDVQVIRPGATQTGMHKKSGLGADVGTDRFPTAESVARTIDRQIARGGRRSTVGFTNAMLAGVGHNLGGVLDGAMRMSGGKGR